MQKQTMDEETRQHWLKNARLIMSANPHKEATEAEKITGKVRDFACNRWVKYLWIGGSVVVSSHLFTPEEKQNENKVASVFAASALLIAGGYGLRKIAKDTHHALYAGRLVEGAVWDNKHLFPQHHEAFKYQ